MRFILQTDLTYPDPFNKKQLLDWTPDTKLTLRLVILKAILSVGQQQPGKPPIEPLSEQESMELYMITQKVSNDSNTCEITDKELGKIKDLIRREWLSPYIVGLTYEYLDDTMAKPIPNEKISKNKK